MMHHALQVLFGRKSEEWNGKVVGVVLPSLMVTKKAVDEKHKAVLSGQRHC